MHSPPLQLQPVSTTHYFVCGDVTIHAGAAIAPGVLLHADPGSKIVIGAGVCIGLGTVLHAHDGTVAIGEGVIIGAGVLLIGDVKIRDRACIGSATTIFNRSIESGTIVPPGSLLSSETPQAPVTASSEEIYEPGFRPPSPESSPQSQSEESDEIESPTPQKSEPSQNGQVHGQQYVNQLLNKLFPHQQRLNNASQDDPSADSG